MRRFWAFHPFRRRPCLCGPLLLAIVLIAAVWIPACSGGAAPGTASSTVATAGDAVRSVTFPTEDGLTLSGHLFGSGTSGVVLSHMYPADQTSWHETAKALAGEGYLVLTYDFRGYGGSGGERQIQHLDRDVLAAAQQIGRAGATRVVLVGASMGGTASLLAAQGLLAGTPSSAAGEAAPPTVAGVATLSAPVSFRGLTAEAAVPKLGCPLLFVAAEEDTGAEGARSLQQLTGGRADLQIVSGGDHGTDLLRGAQAAHVMELLLAFLRKTLP